MTSSKLQEIVGYFKGLQDSICAGLEGLDGKGKFREDLWIRADGGGGRTRIIENGAVFEKGGVNFSHVHGRMPDVITQKLGLGEGLHFDASGVSIVLHPHSPRVPIVHFNVRYFQMEDGTNWFGGGMDLTPIYVEKEDAHHFHSVLKATCDRFSPEYYPKFKAWCDRYFYIKHRKEMRGVGGLFFDHLKSKTMEEVEQYFQFVQGVGDAFLKAYLPIASRRIHEPFGEKEKAFQLFRRSRYVEFNLVYDRGTKFGLDTGGRIESILMSMPPLASWTYNYQPEPHSKEAETIALLQARDWVNASANS